MALPTFQAAGTPVGAISGTIAPAWPAHQAGDIALLITETLDFASGPSLTNHFFFSDPAGFKEIEVSPQQGGPGTADPVPRPGGDSAELRVFWKRATSGAEAAPVIGDSGDHTRAVILTFRGCAASGNPIHKMAGRTTVVAEASVPIPGFTTTDADCLIVDIVATYGFRTFGPWTNASLAALTERLDSKDDALGTGSAFAVNTGTKAVAGVVSATSAAVVGTTAHCPSIKLALTPSDSEANPKAPWLVNVGDRVESITAAITVPWPPHATGDIGVLVVDSPGWPVVLGTPAGFVEMLNSPQRAGTQGAAAATSLNVYWCRATSGAMASPVVNFVNNRITGFIMTFRGCVGAGNPYEVTAGDATNAVNTVTIPGATTTKNDSRIVAIGTVAVTDQNARYMGEANANLVACTAITNFGSSSDGGPHIGTFIGRKAVAGNYGNTTATALPGNGPQAHFSFSLPPPSNDLVLQPAIFSTQMQSVGLLYNRAIVLSPAIYNTVGQILGLSVIHGYVLLLDTAIFETVPGNIELHRIMSGGWTREDALLEDLWVKKPPLES